MAGRRVWVAVVAMAALALVAIAFMLLRDQRRSDLLIEQQMRLRAADGVDVKYRDVSTFAECEFLVIECQNRSICSERLLESGFKPADLSPHWRFSFPQDWIPTCSGIDLERQAERGIDLARSCDDGRMYFRLAR